MDKFFETIYSGCSGSINIRPIPGENEFHPLDNYKWLPGVLKKYNKTNLYFGVATRDGQGGTKENIIDIPCLWIDIDFKTYPKEKIDEVFPKFPLQPTVIVMSGGGYHIYWKLKEPLKVAQSAEIETLLKRLAGYLKGDPKATDVSRVLRVPGSLNNKPEYPKPILVTVASLNPKNVYTLRDFSFLPGERPRSTKYTISNTDKKWYMQALQGVSEPGRNSTAAQLAGRYIGKGLSENETLSLLSAWNLKNIPELTETELRAAVKSIKRTDTRNYLSQVKHISKIITGLKDSIAKGYQGIDPQYEFLRKTIRHILPTHLWIIGGYTSVGKSFFIGDLIMRLYEHGNPSIALFSTEMSEPQYALRLLAHKTTYPSYVIQEDRLTATQRIIVNQAYEFMEQKQLYIYDDLYRFEHIKKTATDLKNKVGLNILIIDYIQNLYGQGTIYERMSNLSPRMQELAKELQITIMALSQVSNESAKTELDIIGYKGAGEIAASADLGLWLERDKKNKNRISMIVRKNRHGRIGQTILEYVDSWTRFDEIEAKENI
jgi:hypothetical protein